MSIFGGFIFPLPRVVGLVEQPEELMWRPGFALSHRKPRRTVPLLVWEGVRYQVSQDLGWYEERASTQSTSQVVRRTHCYYWGDTDLCLV